LLLRISDYIFSKWRNKVQIFKGSKFRFEIDVAQSLSAKVAAALGSAVALAIKVKLVREASFSGTNLFL
jgi:hypothetical protein